MADRDELPPTRFVRLPVGEAAARPGASPAPAAPPVAPASPAAASPAAVAPPRPSAPGAAPFAGFGVSPVTTELRRQEAARGRFGIVLVVAALLVVAFGAVALLGLALLL